MKTVAKNIALIALCATALTGVSSISQAGTVALTGSTLNVGPTPLYGPLLSSNNVVNSLGDPATGSALFDPTGPNLTPSTPWLMQGALTSTLPSYSVAWFYAGSESGFTVTLTAPSTVGPAVTYTEHDNDNNTGGATIPGGFQLLGITTGNTPLVPFTLTWDGGGTISNSLTTNPKPNTGLASLIFSYAIPVTVGNTTTWDLTTTPQDWFVFALNDSGAGDDNHDDFVGFGLISAGPPGGPGFTPIPAALPLFGSVLGGGFLFRRLRNRRKAPAKSAAV